MFRLGKFLRVFKIEKEAFLINLTATTITTTTTAATTTTTATSTTTTTVTINITSDSKFTIIAERYAIM